MPLVLECDGCSARLDKDAAKERGRLARVFLCAPCATEVDTLETALEAERVRLVTAFEQFRDEQLKRARKKLKRLPDE